jgi:hypothetical protein
MNYVTGKYPKKEVQETSCRKPGGISPGEVSFSRFSLSDTLVKK